MPDTTAGDTLVPSLKPPAAGIDSVLIYSADRILFTFDPRFTRFDGNARIHYKSMELEAARIDVRWQDDHLTARSDSALAQDDRLEIELPAVLEDTTETGDSSSVEAEDRTTRPLPKRPRPVKMIDGEQVVTGRELTYDLKTRQGVVKAGETDYQQGRYRGGTIKRVDPEIYNIRTGYYTTCDLSDPHYSFWSRDMKLVVKDKVIARPVVLMFGPVPVAIVPFGVFPARGGRRSGLIVPTYGESSSQGRYFTGLGYYYAPNDYWDAQARIDYYERYGILTGANLSYALRYLLRGSLAGSYINRQEGAVRKRQWDLTLNHSHELSPTANLIIAATFVSDATVYKDYYHNLDDRLRQEVRSDATFNKRWAGTPYSGSLNLHHDRNLATGRETIVLPQASFSRSQSPLIPPPEGSKPDEQAWWHGIFWNYRGQGQNRSTVTPVKTTRFVESGDSLIRLLDESKISRAQGGIRHDLGFTGSFKPFGVLALTPRISYTETWQDEWFTFERDSAGRVDTTKHKEFRTRRTFSTGIGLSTRLYGIFRPRIFGVQAIRHTLSPSLGFTWIPDFSDPEWGYYDRFEGTSGRRLYYDRFGGNLYGATPRGKHEALSIGMENLFEYKRLVKEKEVKGELFSVGMGTSHNFAADSMKWSDLATSLRIRPMGEGVLPGVSGLGFDLTASHSFYGLEAIPRPDGGADYYAVEKPAPNGLRLLSFNLTTSLKFSGGAAKPTPRDTSRTALSDTARRIATPPDWKPSPMPWQSGVSLRYGERRSNPNDITRDVWGSFNLDLQATKNWKVGNSFTYDFVNQQISAVSISIQRDLHCWQGSFTWNPTGVGQGYYLNISVKAQQLRDVKVEKREGPGGGFLPFR